MTSRLLWNDVQVMRIPRLAEGDPPQAALTGLTGGVLIAPPFSSIWRPPAISPLNWSGLRSIYTHVHASNSLLERGLIPHISDDPSSHPVSLDFSNLFFPVD
jgi:hypothetical protein